jgi:hypothetical protein
MTLAGRASPKAPCAVGCAPRAWPTMSPLPHHRPPPPAPPSLRERVRRLAQLGGC